ncbi:MAG: dephospho-CoA kinase [Bacteriovoracaceae bacterium]|nr:dephospho-CoA kinase [Bacteriovoracaceae bacterium]
MMKLDCKYIKLTPEQRLYGVDVPVIGLTGGIATGKSEVSKKLKNLGIEVICADELVKKIYARNDAGDFVKTLLPDAIKNGQIDFAVLRREFFSNTVIQNKIENFIYNLLPEEFYKTINQHPSSDFVVYDVPLLFEKNMEKLVDLVVCVYSPVETQIDRLLNRDNITEHLAREMIAKQMDIEEKKRRTDIIIDNSNHLDELDGKVEEFVSMII